MLIIFLLLNINVIVSETIKIKFKTFKFLDEKNKNLFDIFNNEKNINNDNNDLIEKYFYYDLILNNIYSEIIIGNPPQKIIGFYSGKACHFSLINDKCFIKGSKYNKTISNTFQNLSEFNINYNNYKNSCFAKEHFEFESYEQNKKIIFDNLKFFLTNDNKENINYCALIGLRLNYQDMFIENPKNFIYYLMQYYSNKTSKQKLKSFYWSIKYENSSGYISIGDPPHIYNSQNYKNKFFFEFNIEARYSTINWAIQFKNIFMNKSNEIINLKKYNIEGHNCVFYPELNIILSTNDFFNNIKQIFFDKYFKNKICFIKKTYISQITSSIVEGLNGEYTIIYCEKKKIKDINEFRSEFPSINFYHNLLNITFELKWDDLFYEDNNKLFFLISNKKNEVDQWIFGKTFMNKYQFIFNTEMKTVGFYLNNKKIEKKFDSYYNNIIIILIGFLFLFFALLCFIIYKCRKKYLEENKSVALEMKLI